MQREMSFVLLFGGNSFIVIKVKTWASLNIVPFFHNDLLIASEQHSFINTCIGVYEVGKSQRISFQRRKPFDTLSKRSANKQYIVVTLNSYR